MPEANDMRIHWIHLLICLHLVTSANTQEMEFFTKFKLSVLEDKDYCAIVIDVEDFNYD